MCLNHWFNIILIIFEIYQSFLNVIVFKILYKCNYDAVKLQSQYANKSNGGFIDCGP